MLALTKKTGYALAAMTHLVGLGDGQVASARQIARCSGAPRSLLMSVLKELSAAGYLESVRGARGGYRLKARPEEINLAELVATMEGPIRHSTCLAGGPAPGQKDGKCERVDRCPVADPVHRV